MGEDNTKDITNKDGNELVRDANGRVVSGVLNPNGRPKKGMTLTDAMRDYLEQKNENTGRIRKDEFVQKVAKLAYEGDPTALKLIWNYIDGMPVQKNILANDGERPLLIDPKGVLEKIYGSSGEVHPNSQE